MTKVSRQTILQSLHYDILYIYIYLSMTSINALTPSEQDRSLLLSVELEGGV